MHAPAAEWLQAFGMEVGAARASLDAVFAELGSVEEGLGRAGPGDAPAYSLGSTWRRVICDSAARLESLREVSKDV